MNGLLRWTSTAVATQSPAVVPRMDMWPRAHQPRQCWHHAMRASRGREWRPWARCAGRRVALGTGAPSQSSRPRRVPAPVLTLSTARATGGAPPNPPPPPPCVPPARPRRGRHPDRRCAPPPRAAGRVCRARPGHPVAASRPRPTAVADTRGDARRPRRSAVCGLRARARAPGAGRRCCRRGHGGRAGGGLADAGSAARRADPRAPAPPDPCGRGWRPRHPRACLVGAPTRRGRRRLCGVELRTRGGVTPTVSCASCCRGADAGCALLWYGHSRTLATTPSRIFWCPVVLLVLAPAATWSPTCPPSPSLPTVRAPRHPRPPSRRPPWRPSATAWSPMLPLRMGRPRRQCCSTFVPPRASSSPTSWSWTGANSASRPPSHFSTLSPPTCCC